MEAIPIILFCEKGERISCKSGMETFPCEVERSKIKNGHVLIFSKHTTCGILIQEAERGLNVDILTRIEKLIPKGTGYKHDRIDNNADSHIKTCLIGVSRIIPLINGILQLGTWQSLFLAEFDGPRARKSEKNHRASNGRMILHHDADPIKI